MAIFSFIFEIFLFLLTPKIWLAEMCIKSLLILTIASCSFSFGLPKVVNANLIVISGSTTFPESFSIVNEDGTNLHTFINNVSGPNSIALDISRNKVYVSSIQPDVIEVTDLNGNNRTSITGTLSARSMVVDELTGDLFWHGVRNNRFFKSNSTGTVDLTNTSIENTHLGTINDSAIDQVGRSIYFTESDEPVQTTNTLYKMDLDGNGKQKILDFSFYDARRIAIDSLTGQLFWVNWRDNSGIFKSNLDGTNIVKIFDLDFDYNPSDLIVDSINQRLLFASANTTNNDSIEIIDFNGNFLRSIDLGSAIFNPHGLGLINTTNVPSVPEPNVNYLICILSMIIALVFKLTTTSHPRLP